MGAGASTSDNRTQEDVDAWNTGEEAGRIVDLLSAHFQDNKEAREKWAAAKEANPDGALDLLAAEMFQRIETNEESKLKGKFSSAEDFGAALNAVKDTAPVTAAVKKLMAAMAAIKAKAVFNFASGLPDCCSSNPESYKVVGELPGARLIEMTFAPGAEDVPHEHPAHSMFVISGGKLAISDVKDGAVTGEPHVVEMPSGAPPIMPAGPHQVKNIGDTEVKVIFLEPLPVCEPCGEITPFVTPFSVAPECYKILAEDDNWITGMVTMEPGAKDGLHQHKDHMIYVLEGDGVTLYPAEHGKDGVSPPIKPGDCIPAPRSAAGGLFGSHVMENTGTIPLKMVFFEMKR